MHWDNKFYSYSTTFFFSRFYTSWTVHTPDPFIFRVFWSWSNCGTFLSQSYTTTSHVIVWVVFTTTASTLSFSRFYTNWTRLILTVLIPLLALIFFNTRIFTGIRSPCVVFSPLIFHDLQVTHSMWQVWSGHLPKQHDRHDHPTSMIIISLHRKSHSRCGKFGVGGGKNSFRKQVVVG